MSKLTLGIDMGGTGVKLGLVDARGKLLKTQRHPTPKDSRPADMTALVVEEACKLIKSAGLSKMPNIGVGCAGDIDPNRGVVRISPNLGWRNVPLKALLAKRLQAPILVDNDANVAAWAAYSVEAKRQVKNLLCVTVGTGIGGGLVIDGKLYHGATGTAGEVGHMALYPGGDPCPCGSDGCVERYIGAKAMAKEAKEAIGEGETSLIARMVGADLSNITPLVVKQAAEKGDRLALRLWEQAGTRLGIALASVVNLLNPEWIVLAGGLSRAGTLLLDPLRRTILKRSFPTPAKAVKLVISKLDQDLGMVGAGLLAHEQLP